MWTENFATGLSNECPIYTIQCLYSILKVNLFFLGLLMILLCLIDYDYVVYMPQNRYQNNFHSIVSQL